MARSKAFSAATHRSTERVLASTLSVFSLLAAACAGKDSGSQPTTVTENLAPAVASPATEATTPLSRGAPSGYYSDWADTRDPSGSAPLTEPETPNQYGADPTEPGRVQVSRHTFVPVVIKQSGQTMAPLPTPPSEKPTAISTLSDGQIVKITQTMQNNEIAEARLVAERSRNAQVKEFASQLRDDNTEAKERTTKLAKSEGLTPTESPVSTDMQIKASQELTSVELSKPEEFDRAFIDAQVEENAEMLQLLNSRLIPSATEPKLKTELTKSRSVLERQQEQAKNIQRTLQTTSSAP